MLAFVGATALDCIVQAERLPRRGETLAVPLLGEGPGGTATNAALQAAALGVQATLISRRGADSRGKQIQTLLHGIEHLDTVWAEPAGTTAIALCLVENGERTIVTSRPVGEPALGSIDDEALPVLHNAAYTLIDVGDIQLRAAYAAATFGRKVLKLEHLEEEIAAGRQWQIIVGSAQQHKQPSRKQLEQIGAELCVLTDSSKGGEYSVSAGKFKRFDAPTTAHALDPTGAGDCFIAGVMVGLCKNLSVTNALALGAWCGARAVERVGGGPTQAMTAPQLDANGVE